MAFSPLPPSCLGAWDITAGCGGAWFESVCPTPVPQLKVLEGEGRQQKEELQEVHGRLSQEEQKEEEARREAFTLRQRVVECEAGREAALQEVRFWSCAL